MTTSADAQATLAPPAANVPVLTGVRSPTMGEAALFEAYAEAIKTALAGANSAADKVLTACFSIGTAYVALIGLVQPDKTPSPVVILLPVGILAIAAGLAAVGLAANVELGDPRTVADVKVTLESVIKTKQITSIGAVIVAGIAIVVGAFVVNDVYG